jgi:hypothetical protein
MPVACRLSDHYSMRRVALFSLAVSVLQLTAIGQVPALPNRDTFLAEARRRLASNSQLQSRYTYRERVTELKLNPFGRMGTGPVLVHEVYPIDVDLTYRRLVERDGVAVPRPELAEADRKFLELYREWQRQLAREGKSQREARLKREADARARDRARATEAVEIFTFVLDRRESLAGEPAIVVRFSPKPNARPTSREARVAASFAGQAWIHEFEYEVMRVEATAIDDTSFGLGLVARLHKDASAVLTRERVAGGWLPTETRFIGTGRALLLRKVSIDFRRQYFDYRPFDPEQLPALLGAAAPGNK